MESDKLTQMSDASNWVDALKIDPDKLAGWSAQVPEGTPLLVWCLQNGHIPLEDYMSWAVEQFQLPRLNAEFFQSAFDRSFIPTDRGNSPWSAWCYPVGQWEGLTYVACVEPPREVPTGSYLFVLTDPAVMNAVWSEGMTGTGKTPAKPKASGEAPELPDGMQITSVKPFRLNFGTNSAINIAPLPPSESPVASAPSPAIEESAELPPPPPAIVEAALPPPPKSKSSAFSKPSAMPASPLVAKSATSSEAEAQEIELVFRQLKEHYTSSMILKLDGSNLSLYRWSPEQDLTQLDGQKVVDLTAPSLFRIVQKTQQPYHGYVVESELHRQFFNKIGQASLPASVTAVPLKFEGGVWGMLLALGNESAQRPKALQAVENAAEKLKASLGEVWQKAG